MSRGREGPLIAAADDSWTSFDLGLSDAVANLGAVKEPNLETLLAAEPDLVLASCNTAADLELEGAHRRGRLHSVLRRAKPRQLPKHARHLYPAHRLR